MSYRSKAKANALINEDDYFGAEHHYGIREKEHAVAKEAWLKSLENPDLKNESEPAKASKVEPGAEKFESDLVQGLVASWKTKLQPKERLVVRNYGMIRFDKETPADMIQKPRKGSGKNVEKHGKMVDNLESRRQQSHSNRFANRFIDDSVRSQRHSRRKFGQPFEIGNIVSQIGGLNRQRFAKLQQMAEKDNENGLAFIEDQYFKTDRADVQPYSYAKSDTHSRQTKKSLEKNLKLDKHILNDKAETDSSKDSDLSYIDQQYFSRETDRMHHTSMSVDLERKSTSDKIGRSKFQIDNNLEKDAMKMGELKENKAPKKMKSLKYNESFGSDYIDEQYFGYKTGSVDDRDLKHSRDSEKTTMKSRKSSDVKENLDGDNVKREKKAPVTALTTGIDDTNTGELKVYEKRQKSNLTQEKPMIQEKQVKKPESAAEAAAMKRAELEQNSGMRLFGRINAKKTDSKGFRILSGQVPDFTKVPAHDIADVLRNNIIYDRNDIVAINKPYGLSSRGGPGSRVSIEQLLGDLIPKTRLHLVGGLGKQTTGVLLLSKTEEMAENLKDALKKEDTIKRYIVITKNVPKLMKGEINIPIGEEIINGKVRKKLKPHGDSEIGIPARLSKNAEEAVTRYEVLARQDSWALIECWPLTNVKHQVRVHLALGLNCPILGDHKYSHFDKIAPMKLHKDMLDQLKVRQSKVREIAMHLHGTAVIIPGFLDGHNLVVTAPLPPHFIKNMKSLNLKMPYGKYY